MQARNQPSVARFGGQKDGQTREPRPRNPTQGHSPPSPTSTQSTLTQSGSNSNSASTPSTSPQGPITPPRTGRVRRQYGELGRVPLHRRGTSQTYERLEDLLREAGYKETRIFTPETDRTKQGADGDDYSHEQDQNGPIGALVNFISGFMPGATASRASLVSSPDDDFSPNPLTRQNTEDSSKSSKSPYTWGSPNISPLSTRRLQQNASEPSSQARHQPTTPPRTGSPSVMTSSLESLEPTPRPQRHQGPPRASTPVSHTSYRPYPQPHVHQPTPRRAIPDDHSSSSYARPPQLQLQDSRTSLRPQENAYVSPPGSNARLYDSQSRFPLVYPMPSKAGAYLRHIASHPNIPRPSSTPVGNDRRKRSSPRRTLIMNDTEDEEEERPPMPSTWLQTVAKAVLFGGLGAHVGGPSSGSNGSESSSGTIVPSLKTLRPTRSSLSQASPQPRRPHRTQPGFLQDMTDAAIEERETERNSQFLAPPDLFIRGTAKASATTTEAKTRVVCRSAPTSRSNSRVRGSSPRERRAEKSGDSGRKAKERVGRRPSWKGANRPEKDRVPSLANTDVEGDDDLPWSPRGPKSYKTKGARDRYMGGGSAKSANGLIRAVTDAGHGAASSSEDEDEEDEEDDEDLVDLARILVPPKRQNSIKSLRRHLEGDFETDARDVTGQGRGRIRGRNSSDNSRAPTTNGRGDGAGKTGSGERSPQNLMYDGTEAEECQWGGGWVRGGGGAKGRRGMGMGNEEERHEIGLGEEFYERGFARGDKFDSGRSALGTTSRRTILQGGWGLTGA